MYGFEEFGDLRNLNGMVKAAPVIGETMPAPPLYGCTQTFISVICDSEEECINIDRYINTKFVKALLSILKATQHNPPPTWEYVPLQDFTNNSDIDWRGSLADIDKQLYKKYALEDELIDFIESHFAYHPRFDKKAELLKKHGVKGFSDIYGDEMRIKNVQVNKTGKSFCGDNGG